MVKKSIKLTDRVFSPVEGQDGVYMTPATGASPGGLASYLNVKSRRFNLGKIFTASKPLNGVIISAENLDKWKKKISEENEKPKKRARGIKPFERVFTPVAGQQGIYITPLKGRVPTYVANSLNYKARQLKIGNIFRISKELKGIIVDAKDLERWQEKIKDEKKKPKKHARKIKQSDRVFTPIPDSDGFYITPAKDISPKNLATSLNSKAIKLKLGNIFKPSKELVGVIVKAENLKKWKEAIELDAKQPKKRRKSLDLSKIEFVPIEEGFYFTPAGDRTPRMLACSLNYTSNKFNLGSIFSSRKSLNGVVVKANNLKKWKTKLQEEKKQPKKPQMSIKAIDRVFKLIEGQDNVYWTPHGQRNPSLVSANLNKKAKQLNLGEIFRVSKEFNRVVISGEDLKKWNENLKKEKLKKPKKRAKEIRISERVFTPIEGQPGHYITLILDSSIHHVSVYLNGKAKQLGLDSFFISDKRLKGVRVTAENYYVWLLALAKESPDNSRLQRKVKAFEESHFSSQVIRFGIARKYLVLPDYLPSLPKGLGQGKWAMLEGFNSHFELNPLIGLFGNSIQVTRRFERVQLPFGSELKWGTCGQGLDIHKRISFVFAGRGLEAYVPMGSHHHTIVVLTQAEYDRIKDKLSPKIDVLIVQALVSKSHGDYAQHLGSINSRRIAAMCFAYMKGILKCVFMDDNLQGFSCVKASHNNWERLWDYLSATMGESVCRSIKTHRIKGDLFKPTIGSKLFMVNIQALRTKLTHVEACFSIFYPAQMASLWGGDCFMQSMLIQIFGAKGVSIAPREECVLHRCQRHKNACAKVLKKANYYQENKIETLMGHYKIDYLLPIYQQWIIAALKAMQENVTRNLEYQRSRHRVLSQEDLFKHHAMANNIRYRSCKASLAEDKAFNHFGALLGESKAERERKAQKAHLYAHQQQAIEQIANFKGRKGLVQMTTGSGKTYAQIFIAQRAFENGLSRPIIIVTPTQELVRQFYKDFMEYLTQHPGCVMKPHEVLKVSSRPQDIHAGLLFSNRSLQDTRCVLICCKASYMKLLGGKALLKPPGLLLIDECHKFSQEEKALIETKSQANLILGLTATPKKKVPFSSQTIFNYTRLQAVEEGIIPPFIYDDLGEDYTGDKKDKLINRLSQFLDERIHPCGRPLSKLKGIVYCPSIQDAQRAQEALKETRLSSVVIHSQSRTAKKDIQTFKQSQKGIAFAVNMLQVGFSDKYLDYVLLLKPAKNSNAVSQMAGRVMRGKDKVAYVMSFRDANVENFKTLCDDKALEMCHMNYLLQSGNQAINPMGVESLKKANKVN